MKIQESAENYLEMILILNKKSDRVRSIDIANELGFSKPSVSRAMKLLKTDCLITVDESGYIALTKEGNQIAAKVYEKHNLIANCLMYLGVNETTAFDDACRIEHVISQESFDAIKQHIGKQ